MPTDDHPRSGDDVPAHDPADPDAPDTPETPDAGHAPGAVADAPGWRTRLHTAWPYLRWPVAGAGALFVLAVGWFAWIWFTTDLPDTQAVGESAVVLDRNGDELAVLAQDGLRIEVPLEEMADNAPDALVAAEDRRFYDHEGIDPLGIGRAVWNNVTDDDIEGGSTITQQLVKNLYLDKDRTITRKVREAVLAVKLERGHGKDEILERYLNNVYFGRGAYGIEAAARTYFDTSAAELEPAQSALLIGILRAPEALDPATDLEAATERRDAVLTTMGELGFIDADEAEAATEQPIQVRDKVATTRMTAGVAPHFVEQIRAEVVDEFGEHALYDRGLIIHTTLDIADQKAAEAAVADHLDDPGDPQAAVVGIDRSGAVRAWVGGRDFDELKVDLVSDEAGTGRQPGSTFKPVVLATNFERGFGAGQVFPAPAELTLDIPPEPWTVENVSGQGFGSMTLLEGTVNSVNTVYAQALVQVGPQAVADMAGRLGVERELDPQPSIALGTGEVSPLELTTVFSTLSRSGRRVDPFRITKIETSDGDVIRELDEREGDQVVGAKIADTVSAVLAEVPRRGTATRAALDRPMAAKTGTTQRNADAWLAGYTPEYTAVVWVGNAEGNEPMEPVDGVGVEGGTVPAAIWHDFMAKALEDVEPTPFPEPSQELLGDTRRDLRLDVTPNTVDPGGQVTVEGVGYELCVNGLSVVIEGPSNGGDSEDDDGEPFRIEGSPESDSDASRRQVALDIPQDAALGEYRVSAQCDFGTGPQPMGPDTTLRVGSPEPTATTTSTTSTSSTTTSTTSTSSTTTSTTTTTRAVQSTPDGG